MPKFDRRDNDRAIMRDNIERDDLGRKLTPEAKERAIDFAVDVWHETFPKIGNGDAARLGIKHVTKDVLKDRNS